MKRFFFFHFAVCLPFRAVAFGIMVLVLSTFSLPVAAQRTSQRDMAKFKKWLAETKNIDEKDERGWTPLLSASWSGETEVVELLIQAGADVNAKDEFGSTPLRRAVERDHVEIAKRLVAAGADINAKNEAGFTPLHSAAGTGSVASTKLLLEHDADFNERSKRGSTPVQSAADLKQVETLRLLLAAGASVDEPLCDAAAKGNMEKIKELICERSQPEVIDAKKKKKGVKPAKKDSGLETEDSQNVGTPLQWAVLLGQTEAVRELLAAGANVKARGLLNKRTLLHEAAFFGYVDVIKLLIAGGLPVDVKSDERNPATALHVASTRGNLEAMKTLMEAGANIEATDRNVRTPFQEAIREGQIEAANLLLAAGAHKNAKDKFGNTAYDLAKTPEGLAIAGVPNMKLFNAAEQGDVPLIKEVIAAGADVRVKNMKNQTPLGLAAIYRKAGAVQALLTAGASTGDPLCDAAAKGDIVTLRTMLSRKPDLTRTDAEKFGPPLKWAVLTGQTEAVRMLLKAGSDVNARDDYDKTVLHLAAGLTNVELVKLLIESGADKNARDKGNAIPYQEAGYGDVEQLKIIWELTDTPNRKLQDAANYGDVKAIDENLARGAKIGDKNILGETPLVSAGIGGHKEAILKLAAAGGSTGDALCDLVVKGDTNGLKAALKSKPNVNATDPKKVGTPLKWATLAGRLEAMKLLIAAGADVNVKGINGYTPLHWATRTRQTEAMKVLIAAKADINAKDVNGYTPLYEAATQNDVSAIKILLAAGADRNIGSGVGTTPYQIASSPETKALLKPQK